MSLNGTSSNSKLPPKSALISNSQQNFLSPQQASSPISKLHQYFSSSQYLSSQQQLSIFIQNFPIIDIESSHKSINQILPLLIKQNEMLGRKCQSQVMLIKESFVKHQAVNRQNKKVKEEVQSVQNEYREMIKHKQAEVIDGMRLSQVLNDKIKVHNQFILTQNSIVKSLLLNEFKKCEQLTSSRTVRLCYDDFLNVLKTQSQLHTQEIITLQQIQKYCKEVKRQKKYYSRVKSSIEEFCHRLLKIVTIVPGEMLGKELGHQCQQFLEVVSEMIDVANGDGRKRRDQSGGRKGEGLKERQMSRQRERQMSNGAYKLSNVTSNQSLLSKMQLQQSRSNITNLPFPSEQQTIFLRTHTPSSFQSILSTYMADTTKKYQQTIEQLQTQLHNAQEQLETSKEYYETYLINVRMEYEGEKRTNEEQVTIKDEMIRHFEEELEKCFGRKEQLENRVTVLEEENDQMKVSHTPLVKQVQALKIQLNSLQTQLSTLKDNLARQSQSHLEQLNSKQSQLQQSKQWLISKHKQQEQQHQQQFTKKLLVIKQQEQSITKLNKEIRELKQLVEDKNVEVTRVTKRLYVIEEERVKHLEKKVQEVEAETEDMRTATRQMQSEVEEKRKIVQELNHELALNTTYAKELQAKLNSKDETIQKLNKRLSTTQIQKKSLTKQKQSTQKLQSQLKQITLQLKKVYDQNTGLKRLAKEMKKQLEEVYRTINDLKSIEKDREKLVLESQKSERWKEQIMKDYDEIKFEILKVEAENKSLLLENRHYKNALKRIEMIN